MLTLCAHACAGGPTEERNYVFRAVCAAAVGDCGADMRFEYTLPGVGKVGTKRDCLFSECLNTLLFFIAICRSYCFRPFFEVSNCCRRFPRLPRTFFPVYCQIRAVRVVPKAV